MLQVFIGMQSFHTSRIINLPHFNYVLLDSTYTIVHTMLLLLLLLLLYIL